MPRTATPPGQIDKSLLQGRYTAIGPRERIPAATAPPAAFCAPTLV